jgi:oxygen-independent coproporphyrinogen-3 oxidase
MTLTDHIRTRLRRRLTGEERLALDDRAPAIGRGLRDVDELGLYLHVPFCRQKCPYCPYNKTLFRPELARAYADAVIREIDLYADHVADRSFTSFYIGGGTPTTMLGCGLDRVLEHVNRTFRMRGSIHMESHPNDLTGDALHALADMGVEHLSIGVEALQDHHLRILKRPYTAEQAVESVGRAVANGFRCVNADMLMALPGQTVAEAVETGRMLLDLGVDQIAAYPLFSFPHTSFNRSNGLSVNGPAGVFRRRRMLRALETLFYSAGCRRTSVWAFTRNGVPAYCSVTVPIYLGLGASGGSYLRDIFYLNSFDAEAYIESLDNGRLPVALTVELTEKMQRAGWLYWRLYETRFTKSAFQQRFNAAFDDDYGRSTRVLSRLGLLTDDGEEIALTDAGAYWLHVVQDLFSLDAVGRLWSRAMQTPWPQRVEL